MFHIDRTMSQGTREWVEWRGRVLGASDSPAVMGENPWKRRQYLFEEKLGQRRSFSGNAATREGHALEAPARRLIEKELQVKLSPAIIQSISTPFIAASLDAICKDDEIIVEIKSGKKAYEYASEKDVVPPYNYAQLQHVLLITGFSHMYYASYRPDKDLILFEISRNEEYIEKLELELNKFAKELKQNGLVLQSKMIGKKASCY